MKVCIACWSDLIKSDGLCPYCKEYRYVEEITAEEYDRGELNSEKKETGFVIQNQHEKWPTNKPDDFTYIPLTIREDGSKGVPLGLDWVGDKLEETAISYILTAAKLEGIIADWCEGSGFPDGAIKDLRGRIFKELIK